MGLGNAQLSVRVGIDFSASANRPGLLTGTLLVGLRDSAGNDPVVPYSGSYLLAPALLTLPASGVVGEGGFGWLSGELAVPNDPNLVGQVALFQLWVDDPAGGVVASEVIGVEITAP